jgi:hypothetical protein
MFDVNDLLKNLIKNKNQKNVDYLNERLNPKNMFEYCFSERKEKMHFDGVTIFLPELDILKDKIHLLGVIEHWLSRKHKLT